MSTMRYRFGDFELATKPFQLTRDDEVVALQPQPARALELLVRRAGELVTREELREHLWGLDAVLEHEQAINFTIRKVRQALDEQATRPRFVETLPRQGYRFVASVERVDLQEMSTGDVELHGSVGRSEVGQRAVVEVPISEGGDLPGSASSVLGRSARGHLRAAPVLVVAAMLVAAVLGGGVLGGWNEGPGVDAEPREDLAPEQVETLWKARTLLDEGGADALLRSRVLLESLFVEAPDSPTVSLGLADAWAAWGALDRPHVPERPAFSEWMPELERWAERARSLDPSLVDAHLHVAKVRFHWHRDMRDTERLLEQEVLSRSPNHGGALHLYGLYLVSRGRFDAGIESIRRAVELAPEELYLHSDLGWALLLAGRNEESAEVTRRLVTQRPRYGALTWMLSDALRRDGHEAEALEVVRNFFRVIEGPEPDSLEAAYRHADEFLAHRDAAGSAVLSDRAHFLCALGEVDAAIELLRRACTERPDYALPYVDINPAYAILRAAPEYDALRDCLVPPS